MRPILQPGTHALQRPDGSTQLGLDPATAERVREHPAPRAAWDPRQGSPGLAAHPRLPQLLAAGLAAPDDRALRDALPADRAEHRWQRHTLAALFRDDPALMAARHAERGTKRFRVHGFGHPLDDDLREALLDVLRRSGLAPDGPKPPGPPPRHQLPSEPVHVLLGVGEPARSRTDPLLREAVPHLVVRLTEGRAVVGPFVLPGLTACLRCTDLAAAGTDPAWPQLVEQYARATRRGDRADGVPEPVDAALAAVAVGWAARELATYAEGGTPRTLSATLTLGRDLADPAVARWRRHPECGCSWTSAQRRPA